MNLAKSAKKTKGNGADIMETRGCGTQHAIRRAFYGDVVSCLETRGLLLMRGFVL